MKIKGKYSIGEVSETCNVPIKTLRYYDEIKLVIPKFRDEDSKYRYYSKDQMVTLCIIRKLRSMGFCLKEIQNIVIGNKANNLEKSIEHNLSEIANELLALQEKYAEGYSFLQRLKKGADILACYSNENINTELVSIEEIPEIDLLFTKKIMNTYSNSEVSLERWVEIVELCNKLKLKSKGTIVVTYHAGLLDEFLFKDLDVEFGIQIESSGEGSMYRKFGGFLAATAIHAGNYADIINTHIQIIQWVNKNGYRVAGNVSEEFIISPLDVNNVDEHVTKVIIPVEKIVTEKADKEIKKENRYQNF